MHAYKHTRTHTSRDSVMNLLRCESLLLETHGPKSCSGWGFSDPLRDSQRAPEGPRGPLKASEVGPPPSTLR